MLIDLSHKIVLITGVGGGIGTALLEHCIGKPKFLITSSRTADVGITNSEKHNFFNFAIILFDT